MILHFTAHGTPAAQGSKRHVGNGVMVESSKKVKPWRQDVVAAALEAIEDIRGFEPLAGPVDVDVVFYFVRPKSHYRANGRLKESAPEHVAKRPDIEKVLRSTFDAMTTAGVWRDDALVVRVAAEKLYAEAPGADVTVWAAVPA